MSRPAPLHLFAGFGVELEYMIVDSATLAVKPLTDRVIRLASGQDEAEDYEDGVIGWSNELVNHVIELKTNGPAATLTDLEGDFAASVRRINELLQPLGARLMPTAMHPWMNPDTETQLWPHGHGEVYLAFDRIFNCKGHGWANLQSTHLNLPFADDEEFARLHAAIRLVLPLLPALAASSPLMEGKWTGLLDSRLDVYRTNCARIPSLTAQVIPEPVYSAADYQQHILQKLYTDIAPHDPDEVLREEWLNARGAIARFSRNTIEIRVLDIQECPAADLAITRLVVAVLRGLVEERWCGLREQQAWPVLPLFEMLRTTIRDAEQARLDNAAYLRLFGLNSASASARDLWQHLASETGMAADPALQVILSKGTLARRIRQALYDDLSRPQLMQVYGQLCDCLASDRLFLDH